MTQNTQKKPVNQIIDELITSPSAMLVPKIFKDSLREISASWIAQEGRIVALEKTMKEIKNE